MISYRLLLGRILPVHGSKAHPRPQKTLRSASAALVAVQGLLARRLHSDAAERSRRPRLQAESRSLAGFAGLHLRPSVLDGIRHSFPLISTPTPCQREFIPACIRGQNDIFIRDSAGSGKSLGLVWALLSQQRQSAGPKGPAISSIFLVPHASLASQLMTWIQHVTPQALHPRLRSIAQMLVRGDAQNTLQQQLQQLREDPPHIVVTTPQALLEVWKADPDVLQVQKLQTIVLDEADYMLGFSSDSAKTFQPETAHPRPHHPPPAMVFLDELFNKRGKFVPRTRFAKTPIGRVPLQVVLSSATFPAGFRDFVLNHTQWVTDPSQQEILEVGFSGADVGDLNDDLYHRTAPAHPGIANSHLVKHYCLQANAHGAIQNLSHEDPPASSRGAPARNAREARGGTVYNLPTPETIEAIATLLAVDVPRLALLVVEASAPVLDLVKEFRKLGVDAAPLDLSLDEQRRLLGSDAGETADDAVLLISTRASTRGIDLPLSHVFILGVPENPLVYRHLAGRVGRRGKEGHVVQILEAGADEARMREIYRRLGVHLSTYETHEP